MYNLHGRVLTTIPRFYLHLVLYRYLGTLKPADDVSSAIENSARLRGPEQVRKYFDSNELD